MQKVTAFLEQHIQWIAIGLGALFCLYMTYSYVITPPASVEINGTAYGPSEVDPYTWENAAQKLQSAMTNNARIKMEVPQYVQAFQSAMTWQGAKPVELAGMFDPALTRDVLMPAAPTPPPGTIQPGQQLPPGVQPGQQAVAVAGEKIKALPVPPKPKYLDPNTNVKYGRSVIIPPPQPGVAPQPPQQPGVIPPGAVDSDWVTQMWTVSMPEMDQAFRQVGIDKLQQAGLSKTMFLQVEMVREEMVDGQWGNQTVVPANTPTRDNQPRMPFPDPAAAGQALRQAQFQYIAWAAAHTPDIIQPLFHVTVPNKGDQWTKPGAQLAVGAVFDPATHVGGKGNLSDEQWNQVLQYRREQYRLQQEQKKQQAAPRAPRTPRGVGPGAPPDMEGEGMYAPARNLPHYAPAPGATRPPPYPIPGRRGYGGGGYGDMPPEMLEGEGMYGGYGGGAQVAGMPQPGTDYPNGEFDPCDPTQPPPAWKMKDVEIWAHDDQVQPGKTYRYRMRYKLKNPIFGANNLAEPKELQNEFALVSEWSDWTTPITVPSLVNFFVAGGFVPGRGTVAFEVFRWDQGQQKMERFEVGPGDLIGWEKNGVDFKTDWTVVDFREDPRANNERQILLVNNETGEVVARSFSTDRNDRLYQALKKQVEDLRAAERAAQAAGGTIPPANGTAAAR